VAIARRMAYVPQAAPQLAAPAGELVRAVARVRLDPQAPMTVEPFTPAILGTKQIANFTTTSYPGWGTALVGAFAVIVLGVTLWHMAMAMRSRPHLV
jgi:hypothetical protein